MIRIAIASDNTYVQHCGAFINSVIKYNSDVQFYFLTEGITDTNAEKLKKIANKKGCEILFFKVPSGIVSQFPMTSKMPSHISLATYYRLFLTTILPETVDKILYLDCDMIVRGSLLPLWEIDLSNHPIAAVYQHFGNNNDSWERLGIQREQGYFNAGCLLMNLALLRNMDFQNRSFSFIEKNYDRIIFHDQDVLNALFSGQVYPLSCKWNYLSLFYQHQLKQDDFPIFCNYIEEISSSDFSPVIVHFVSAPKPWEYGCDNPYIKEYFDNLKGTPWESYKVKFSLRNFMIKQYSRLLLLFER